ncbi:hypothetical protein [Corynebacterium phocae]|uniref:hypothetical protein n=1 Tax=Corynebacterium phocae TaxID=161895 RepID=UPI00123B1C50|nr:hypothetical protein [Corynebacterium phocae]KAA8725054.1 hypothetical protein F4V58_05180 [Corynebacterium phocae]
MIKPNGFAFGGDGAGVVASAITDPAVTNELLAGKETDSKTNQQHWQRQRDRAEDHFAAQPIDQHPST